MAAERVHDEQEHDPVEDVDGTEGDQEAEIERPFIGAAAEEGKEQPSLRSYA